MQIFFISRQRILGSTNGSSAYLLDLARAVRDAGMTPHLVQPAPTLMGRTPVMRLGPELAVFASHRIRGVAKIGRFVLSLDPALYAALARAMLARLARAAGIRAGWAADRPAAYSVAIAWSGADLGFVRRACRDADVVLADYCFQAEAFAALAPPRPATAIVMHDLFHARAASSIAGSPRDSVALLGREAEIALLARADAVIAIQRDEADFVRDHVPGPIAITAPMAAAGIVAAPSPGDGRVLLFVGSNTAPNVVGLRWFFDTVWPDVRAAVPGITLDVAGTVARGLDGVPDGVRLLGLVPDLAPLYAAAGIIVSPLTFGSGLKIKLVEAMAHGKAIVATSVTLQGVEGVDDAVVRADDPAAFAAALVALASDDARRVALAGAALTMARERFSPDACYGAFTAWALAAGAAKAPAKGAGR